MSVQNQKIKLLEKFANTKNNPYMFSVQQLNLPTPQKRNQLSSKERSIVREQHKTLFENDDAMQELFRGNFDEYFNAIEDPNLMIRRMDERMHEIENAINNKNNNASRNNLDDLFTEELDDTEDESLLIEPEIEQLEMFFENDLLYQKSDKWSEHLHELGHSIYDHQNRKDPDVFRVTINACMVVAKIAYAADMDEAVLDYPDKDIIAMEIKTSIRGYELALTFLQRVRESMVKLINKKFEPMGEWRNSLLVADEIVLEIQSRIVNLKRKLYPPSK